MNDDKLYVFEDKLNKELKEIIDDLIVTQLYYFFSLVCVFLGIIGYIKVFIFNIKDQDEIKNNITLNYMTSFNFEFLILLMLVDLNINCIIYKI